MAKNNQMILNKYKSNRFVIGSTIILLLMVFNANLLAETLTLDQALELAFTQSPTIKQAKLNLEISERNLKANQASLKSQFNLTLNPYQYSKRQNFDEYQLEYYIIENTSSSGRLLITQPIKWSDGTFSVSNQFYWEEYFNNRQIFESLSQEPRTTSYNNLFTVSYNQPLFTYNRTRLQEKELELDLENATLSYAIQKLQIESNVTQEFLSLFHYQKSVQINKEEFSNANESYEIIKSKVDAGISAKEELYQAELSLANSRAGLENNQIMFENALDNFKIMLGMSLDTELEVTADVQKMLVEVILARAIEYGLSNRMELRQKDIDIQNAMFNLTRIGAQNEFKASIDLSYGLTSTNEKFGHLFDSPNKDQSVGITVNIPLFDWGEKKHRMAAGKARIEQQKLSAGDTKNTIVLEIRQAYRTLQNQKTQIEIAETNVKNARLTYELNLERYKNGDLSSKDMGFYQNQLSNEQLGEVQALINYKIALLDLKIKTLYDFKNKLPVVNLK